MTESIWSLLSKVDVSDATLQEAATDNGFVADYIPWMAAWHMLKSKYPDADYGLITDKKADISGGIRVFPDSTADVHVWVRINETEHRMWLPVMDRNFDPVIGPTATEYNQAFMRCLVKCIAMFGLGWEVYMSDKIRTAQAQKVDVPAADEPEEQAEEPQQIQRRPTGAIGEGEAQAFYEGVMKIGMPAQQNIEQLRSMWKDNIVMIEKIKQSFPDIYAEMEKQFKETAVKLTAQAPQA